MEKEQILAEALEKYPSSMKENISVGAGEVMMVIYHLGRMKDCGGFLEVQTHELTGMGLDLAKEIHDKGWKLELEKIFEVLNDIFEEQNNAMLSTLIYTTQNMSIAEMKEINNG